MNFLKLHACGNSCLVTVAEEGRFNPDPKTVVRLLDFRRGLGAENLMIIRPAGDQLNISGFNQDGSAVGMCANGLRCCGLALQITGLLTDRETKRIPVNLDGRSTAIEFLEDGYVAVDVGKASFEPQNVPIRREAEAIGAPLVEIEQQQLFFTAVNVGNPHCVIHVPDVTLVEVADLGARIEKLACFPERTNVEFVQVVSPEKIKVRFWERGVGLTESSGSGSCAAAVASRRLERTGELVRVECPGGELQVQIDPETWNVKVSGRPEFVYSTDIDMQAFC